MVATARRVRSGQRERRNVMAFWDQLKAKATELNGQLQTKTVQFKNKEFANGSMAMCALIAAADGTIDPAERQKTAALISGNEALKVFPAEELRQKFDWYCDKLAGDFDFGKVEAIATIGKLKGKPDQARAVIQIGIIIGGADGHFDDHEKAAVKNACFSVGIDPSEFEL
ncbi:Tellurite resistance TerB [Rhodococcus sp. 06-156-3C]|nr:Tellurite resistance TerB [Rhodococcus sp. 06-156-4C]OZD16495.1 Tellurite resistance TerB [Rhodococcus sp. 06-156-4a]OZD26354.1 Tellurite resistance TerB [Rhodococcus sp. 06-156-3C]OZD31749.1 Tellurite resistance TerB [Rhodococcus sp. 06-156-3b]OZD35048.1 Tellurite resistance TerB [Rhodococcus sp. 06-156-3]OZF63601.1 Tellurite resistance TerB [Rhodococcus sp. 06-156-4]